MFKLIQQFLQKVNLKIRSKIYSTNFKFIHNLFSTNKHTVINVGILYICVGKYDKYFKNFYKTAQKNFLLGSNKTYFVFTDSVTLINRYRYTPYITFIETKKIGWPYDTLLRNRYFMQHFHLFANMDYLIFCNANMVFKENIFLNDLGLGTKNKLFGVLQPYYFHKRSNFFPVESNLSCNAYFSANEIEHIEHYFQGCFYGGNYTNFRILVETISEWTEDDLIGNKIPVWHDESYLNKFFHLNPPFVLHSGYAYPEEINLPFKKNILMLQKSKQAGHNILRS